MKCIANRDSATLPDGVEAESQQGSGDGPGCSSDDNGGHVRDPEVLQREGSKEGDDPAGAL